VSKITGVQAALRAGLPFDLVGSKLQSNHAHSRVFHVFIMLAHRVLLCKWQQISLLRQAADYANIFKSRSLKHKEGILIDVKNLVIGCKK